MWGVVAGLLLVGAGNCLQSEEEPDASVGRPLPLRAQEWGVLPQPIGQPEPLGEDDATRPYHATRLQRRRRKRIRPYGRDYDELPAPLRPTRPRYDLDDTQEPLLFPEDRPYRGHPRRRRLKPRQRLALPSPDEEPWRDDAYPATRRRPALDDAYPATRRRPALDDDYVPPPRPRPRKRRPLPQPNLDEIRDQPLSREVMIYGDDPVPSPTTAPEEVSHRGAGYSSTTTTERVNTFRPSKPRRATTPSLSSEAVFASTTSPTMDPGDLPLQTAPPATNTSGRQESISHGSMGVPTHNSSVHPRVSLDAQESSDIDPALGPPESGRHKATLPSPVKIQLDPRIRSIEELIQKTRQSLGPALDTPTSGHTASNHNEPMKKTIPLSTSSLPPITVTPQVQNTTRHESVSQQATSAAKRESTPRPHHARNEILELLQSQGSSSRLARILAARNMTLEELFDHRERGSSQQHLADMFSSTGRPATSNCTSDRQSHRSPVPVADRNKYTPLWESLRPHFTVRVEARPSEEPWEAASANYVRVDLDEGLPYGETEGKVDTVQSREPAVIFSATDKEQELDYDGAEVLGGFSAPVRSGVIASGAVLLLTVLVFVGILVGCRWRQRRARRRYVEGIVGARERSTSTDELRGKGAHRSHTPVLVGARDLYGRAPDARRYYLWNTIRKTLRYK